MRGAPDDPRLHAAIDLLRRTGARDFQLRYSDDEEPIVWMALAGWYVGRDGTPVATAREAARVAKSYNVAASFAPLDAVFALCDETIDGGTCAHCGRPSGFIADVEHTSLDDVICWFQWDPETNTYMRGCEARDA